ncbi:MAG: sigma-54-dependent Fis family transcriptional regulator [Proteobacteria bacterium]|nr:sigma-54-dependent Fis family transcriptional regulator [Pseudomonadota bacterium]MBU4381668.1 sigma-54-dependent Fis family transcriptional regulator [Pseudomonadota bacterium]MCG2766655.1 sigma-54-dependent Fis family transcriptional regulator [Desulfarculaceae bacterium]
MKRKDVVEQKIPRGKLSEAWQQFAHTGQVDRSYVRSDVADSWQRCYRRGLRPNAPKGSFKLSSAQLARIRAANADFIEAALPFMRFLQSAVRGTGFILVLTNADGVLLDVFGDEDILRMARDNNYVAGSSRAEEEVGTNSIGLCLVEKKPMQVTGPEHYNERHHDWTCSSAPVFSPEGSLLGAITLSGKSSSAHLHTLGMVISAAEAIENKLKQRKADKEKSNYETLLESLLGSISEAVIAVNHKGVVTHANQAACRMAGFSSSKVLGKSIDLVFPGQPLLMEMALNGKDYGNVEVGVDSSQGRNYLILRPFMIREDEKHYGFFLVMSERSRFFNELRKVSGHNARFTFEDIKGGSPEFLRQIKLAKIAAGADSRVLIMGETGTGKELFAQAIHNASERSQGPFVAINCAAIPRELIESEILGYKEGAFTGARKGGQVGKLELADGGTIFLDEVGEMPLDAQTKFLRVLQDGMITRLGDNRPLKVDVRVIAATNEDLVERVASKGFRQDLYFRLSVVELNIPPLRGRLEDLPLLVEHVLGRVSYKLGARQLGISPEALEVLNRYQWPGNVRELGNILEMAAIVCDDREIKVEHLPQRIFRPGLAARVAETVQPMKQMEAEVLKNALAECDGNVAKVARSLGLSRSTIYRRMKEMGIGKSVSFD